MPEAGKRPVVLFGYPLEHSLSPLIHNTAFEYQSLDLHYSLCPVSPDKLEQKLRRLVGQGLVGANVTVPHKESVAHLLDEPSDVVRTIGAANTVSCRRSKNTVTLAGDNTDVGGFIAPIRDRLLELDGRQALIFGSGGAARAVGYALATQGSVGSIVIAGRNAETGNAVVDLLRDLNPNCEVGYVALETAGLPVRSSALIVNATPIGMGRTEGQSVWIHERDFHPDQIVYDLIYWPLQTRLLQLAGRRGATTLGGLEMLIAQAALSYSIWTGREMPVDVVRDEVRSYLAEQG
jgi:shikimate dehydrogenase